MLNNDLFERALYYFRKLCKIPHGSGNTALISDYCCTFAKEHSLSFIKDSMGNVIIFKKGSRGCENRDAVIIQGHLDMVAVKNDGVSIDLEKDGLTLIEDDDFISANGTSLGGDDGIAVAFALAVLESDSLVHPPLEAVFTVDEEIGMLGASFLDTSVLSGKRLINLDSEDEGVLLVSCAGGVRADISLPAKLDTNNDSALKITLSGFTGGHSGTEINKNRLNAIVETAKLLKKVKPARLVSIDGGNADNAIPVSCTAIVTGSDIQKLRLQIENEFAILKAKAENDPQMRISTAECTADKAISEKDSARIIECISEIPNGVISLSKDIDNLVQTSLNLGIIKTDESGVSLCHALRSNINSERAELEKRLTDYAENAGGKIAFHGSYPAWEYKENSRLREVICACYEKQSGKKMRIESIHAGLECGFFCGKISGLDCVSLGPDIFDIHTSDEKLSKQSAKRVFELLIQILEQL